MDVCRISSDTATALRELHGAAIFSIWVTASGPAIRQAASVQIQVASERYVLIRSEVTEIHTDSGAVELPRLSASVSSRQAKLLKWPEGSSIPPVEVSTQLGVRGHTVTNLGILGVSDTVVSQGIVHVIEVHEGLIIRATQGRVVVLRSWDAAPTNLSITTRPVLLPDEYEVPWLP